ncbi:MAG: glycosyl transferase family protein [Rhodobacteraceae bacterium]|nr:glycosyl transferase family protein [Paracoccaceae bacterium]
MQSKKQLTRSLPEPHPFSPFVAILARGKTKTRSLTLEEATTAMQMILQGDAKPEQIGAFLMLLRLKEETPMEIAGFTLGARAVFDLPNDIPPVDIDWSSYAGKRIQLPWFILSALALAGAGYRVFMHGTDGHTSGRVYTQDTLEHLGVPIALTLSAAADQVRAHNFAYAPLEALSPKLRDLILLRPLLGLRSPVHSFSRMLNPFSAPMMMQGIFHRGFMDIHASAAMLLNQPQMAVFRGEGGEIERRPNKPTVVWSTRGQSQPVVETWPALLPDPHQPANAEMNVSHLAEVWAGDRQDPYAEASITGTMAIALKAVKNAASFEEAQSLAIEIWNRRDKSNLVKKA